MALLRQTKLVQGRVAIGKS